MNTFAAAFGVFAYVSALPPSPLLPGSEEPQLDLPAASAAPAAALDPADARFLTAAAQDNLAALAEARLLAERSGDAMLRSFAARLVAARSAQQETLAVLAIRKDLRLPTRLDAAGRRSLAQLRALPVAELDRQWQRRLATATRRAAALYAQAARQTQDAEVKAYADTGLPLLRTLAVTGGAAAASMARNGALALEHYALP